MSEHIWSVIVCVPIVDDKTKYLCNFPLCVYNVTDALNDLLNVIYTDQLLFLL